MKRKIGKSIVSMVLAAVMCLSLLPMSAFAMDYLDPETFTTVEDGVLTQYLGGWGETDIIIPEGVTSIGGRVFWFDKITSIKLPNTLTRIEYGAFSQCKSLTSITIPDAVTTIGMGAFTDCRSLTSVTLPDSLTTIDGRAFENCTSLTSVTIPNSVTTMGMEVFRGCTNLTSVTIPDSLTEIPANSFIGCESLTSVIIPNSITEIDHNAFDGCSSLTNITIPDSVRTIDVAAFKGCTNLTSVTIPDSVEFIGVSAFYECAADFVLKGKSGSYAEEYAKSYGITFSSTGGTPTTPTEPTAPTTPTEPTTPPTPTTPTTTDKPSAWAEAQVNTAITASIVPQALQSAYTQATTRAEFCALAVALYEKVKGTEITERTTFNDTTDVNIQKAAGIGVVSGVGNNNFAPNDKLTREQAATMLSRLAAAIGKPLTEQAATFADNGTVSTWAAAAVGQMQATGIMGGVGNNTFAPQDDYTREQSIATALRLYDIVK